MIKTSALAPVLAAVVLTISAEVAMAANIEPYVGKYPFDDKVRGRTIYQMPGVKRDFIAKFGQPAGSGCFS